MDVKLRKNSEVYEYNTYCTFFLNDVIVVICRYNKTKGYL